MNTNLISKRLELIKPSPTLAVTAKAKALKAEGKDVIGLGAGEPDFDTPENVKQAAYDAIKSGKTKYTPVDGIPELKEAIVKKFNKENRLNYELNNITVGCGAKHVIFNIISATINPGDEVIIPSPYWVSYPDMVLINGGKPVIATTSIVDNFKLTPKILKNHITNQTKLLILNSPSNPTGSCYSENELSELANVLKDYPNIYIISDDIYEHIRYQNNQFQNIANINEEMQNRTFVVNGVSKAYSMTGWRIGYAAGSKEAIKAVAKIQSQSTSNPCSISQYASVEALSENSYEFIEKNKIVFKDRLDLVLEKLSKIKGIKIKEPDGAFYVFPNCQNLIGSKTPSGKQINNCTDFGEYLLEEVLVAVVPGIAFGSENHFRVSYAISNENLIEACSRIKAACEKLT
ncbi:pyridoxal phosphate-dependent aminotransferase [Candidatus Aquarickettsia rohweri]|uniref:Aminotransferase n=1 Tax=Candidatus Aquarickettsia rohweri TaxID=2602574 RepID=A0A3R9ZEI1_9RICK|nr:pyridoxal phosphate-dependent aminotransferase [Candidatus Aquarickettsia rohweri]RST62528.1 pyridoxal phosphate-dependent aminotransferase [Candidatus Aquarickettsia rohweri]